jgi:type VI secretion system secreted protein Hcp
MAFEGYVSFKGKNQGQFKGSSTKKPGHPHGSILIQDFSYATTTPVDVHSGQSTGRRQHKPVVITREVDSASPVLLQACLNHTAFESAELFLPKASSGGGAVPFYKIELVNGTITRIGFASSKGGKRREAITIDYEQIKVNGAPTSPKSGPQPLWWHDSGIKLARY